MLNISRSPIAYKYREGNVKRTLKRELKVFETVNDQAIDFIVVQLLVLIYLHTISLSGGFHLREVLMCL